MNDHNELRRVAQAVRDSRDGTDDYYEALADYGMALPPAVTLSLLDEIDQLKAEVKALRPNADRYRYVSDLAWYVERAAQVYNLCNVNSRWASERGSPDRDRAAPSCSGGAQSLPVGRRYRQSK